MVKLFLCLAIQPKFSLNVWKYPRNICSWYVNAYFSKHNWSCLIVEIENAYWQKYSRVSGYLMVQ